MKTLLFRAIFWMSLAAEFLIISICCRAEAHCPGNLPGLHPRLVAGSLLVVPVKINQSGPFDFMVDTGSQLNVIDPALAAQFDLKSQAKVGLVATTSVFQASVVILDSLMAGSQVVSKPLAAVQDLRPLQAVDPRIRGVLGENFLAHFDVLIDYPHRLVCLDEAKLIERGLQGERIPLVTLNSPEKDLPFCGRLLVAASFSDAGNRPILLQVDSGSNGPVLYASNSEPVRSILKQAAPQGPRTGDERRAFVVLPPQDMRLGSRTLQRVPFVTPANGAYNASGQETDGILATVLFQRVYVSHSDHFIIFDPK